MTFLKLLNSLQVFVQVGILERRWVAPEHSIVMHEKTKLGKAFWLHLAEPLSSNSDYIFKSFHQHAVWQGPIIIQCPISTHRHKETCHLGQVFPGIGLNLWQIKLSYSRFHTIHSAPIYYHGHLDKGHVMQRKTEDRPLVRRSYCMPTRYERKGLIHSYIQKPTKKPAKAAYLCPPACRECRQVPAYNQEISLCLRQWVKCWPPPDLMWQPQLPELEKEVEHTAVQWWARHLVRSSPLLVFSPHTFSLALSHLPFPIQGVWEGQKRPKSGWTRVFPHHYAGQFRPTQNRLWLTVRQKESKPE